MKNYDFIRTYAPDHWNNYFDNMEMEYRECLDEGREVEDLKPEFDRVIAMPTSAEKENAAERLFEIIEKRPIKADYPYFEPSGLEQIKAARPESKFKDASKEFIERRKKLLEDPVVLRKRLYGAWLGRICGCLLGKNPVEGMMKEEIDAYLRKTDNYPLQRYFKLVDNVTFMPSDDDTNYPIMYARKLLTEYGRDFTPWNVAAVWIKNQPITEYWTAERYVMVNFINGISPTESAVWHNPCREMIGAQIRGDYFGYINPGQPEAAAEMAWRDACISHVKNGIYGEMFVAAALAVAAVSDDISEIIEGGLSQIPEKSRFTEDIRTIIGWYESGVNKEECFNRIHERWDEHINYDWLHTNSNAQIVTASLLYGGGDYGRTICTAVETGFDTDCNGATAGSILGMAMGKDAIGSEWSGRINDTCDSTILGCGMQKISELVELTVSHIDN